MVMKIYRQTQQIFHIIVQDLRKFTAYCSSKNAEPDHQAKGK